MLPAEARRAPRVALLALGALILALVAGCGDEDEEARDGGDAGTELEVTLDPDGPGAMEPRTESVSCEPPVDGSPCSRLEATDLAPLDPMTPCTEIYGGPDEVTVAGTIAGEEVNAVLTRANGCEIDRFDRLLPLLRELFPGYQPGASLAPERAGG